MEKVKIDLNDKSPPAYVRLMWYMEDRYCFGMPNGEDIRRPLSLIKAYQSILLYIGYVKKNDIVLDITFKGLWHLLVWQQTGKIINERAIREAVMAYNAGLIKANIYSI